MLPNGRPAVSTKQANVAGRGTSEASPQTAEVRTTVIATPQRAIGPPGRIHSRTQARRVVVSAQPLAGVTSWAASTVPSASPTIGGAAGNRPVAVSALVGGGAGAPGGWVVGDGTTVVCGAGGTVTAGNRSPPARLVRTARPPASRAQASSTLSVVSLTSRRRARRYSRAGSGGLTACSPCSATAPIRRRSSSSRMRGLLSAAVGAEQPRQGGAAPGQPALHRADREPQLAPDLLHRQLDHVVQDQDLPLAQGQPAQGRHHVDDLGGWPRGPLRTTVPAARRPAAGSAPAAAR